MNVLQIVHKGIPYLLVVFLPLLILSWYLGDSRLSTYGLVLLIAYVTLYFLLLIYSVFKESEMTLCGMAVIMGVALLLLVPLIVIVITVGGAL